VNGLTELFLTKLDVLSGLPSVKICTAYRFEGQDYEDFPPHQSIFHRAEPVYEQLEGWSDDITAATAFGDLPAAARAYVERLAELAGVPIGVVSVGAAREQSLVPAAA
jgi:adenylosuccinate synthase